MDYEVAIVGGGIAGMATAARLQAGGLSTIVLEAHRTLGGCAGYFRRRGFAFDVGATTLVDFGGGGVGGELLREIGMESFDVEFLPGYVAWLPDRAVTLHRDPRAWEVERQAAFGTGAGLPEFWQLVDRLSSVFWEASRRGLSLPIQTPLDILRLAGKLSVRDLPLARFMNWSMSDALEAAGQRENRALTGLLSMLVEDTVHSTLDAAPLINASLGVTIRGAGLARAKGGMYGFWKSFAAHYQMLCGTLKLNCPVLEMRRDAGRCGFLIRTAQGHLKVAQVVSTLPVSLTADLGAGMLADHLKPYLERNAGSEGGAIAIFLGVPESEVAGQDFTHHQILHDYDLPLGNGNNMFLSVSSPGDTLSAPEGWRTVVLSTHCDLEEWKGLTKEAYILRKTEIASRLLGLARRVYPNLGERPAVFEVATPQTYERYTRRPGGAVGGFRLHPGNSNQKAIPHDIGIDGFWLGGDTTWPGLGTVACVLGSRTISRRVLRFSRGTAKGRPHPIVGATKEIAPEHAMKL